MPSNLKKFIEEYLLQESNLKVSISQDYMKKEAVRQQLQELIKAKIAEGEIADQAQFEDWIATAKMAFDALKMVPIEAYKVTKKKKL
jgi:hypothetical protein